MLEASIDLFSGEGFWNTPTSRIAKHAGVGTGTLFNYFGSKEGLIDEVYLELKQEWVQYILAGWPENSAVREQLEHLWFRSFDWAIKYPDRHALKQQLHLSELVTVDMQHGQEESLAFAIRLFDQAVINGVLIDISLDYFTLLLQAQVEAAIEYARSHELQDMALLKHIGRSFEIFWNSVKGR